LPVEAGDDHPMRATRQAWLAAAPAACVLLAGCHASACIGSGCDPGTIDTAKAETAVRTLLTHDTGAQVRSVSCPPHVRLRQGASFTCTATGADATTAPVLVTQTDGKGKVHISAPDLLHTGAAAEAIAAGLSRRLRFTVRVRCPDLVRAHKGTRLTCTATDPKGATRPVAVTVTDDQGAIDYRLR
jgi:hypothetical protein